MSEPMCDMSLLEANYRGRPYIEQLGRLEFWQPERVRELTLSHAWGVRVHETRYVAPAAMTTDGASIPRVFWRLIDPPLYSLLVLGAVLHDACYGGICRCTGPAGDWLPVEKSEADELLRMLALWNGAPQWKADAVWRAVRHFGRGPWESGHAANAGVDLRLMDYHVPPALNLPLPSAN